MTKKHIIRDAKIIHIIPHGDVSTGGASYAAVRLANEQARNGAEVCIIQLKTYFNRSKNWCSEDVIYINGIEGGNTWLNLVKFYKLCRNSKYSIHFHGIWFPEFLLYYLITILLKVNYVISPHGSLEPGALRQKFWKKFFARKLFFNLFCRGSNAMLAFSEKEKSSIGRLFPTISVHVVPIGVDMPTDYIPASHKAKKSGRKVIFVLSRISPGKGILNLIRAWDQVRNRDWKIQIAGPNENEYQEEMEREINSLGLDNQISFIGYVDERQRDELYRSADLFVLPSLSENFGIVVPEAMSYGVPVLTTNQTPWVDVGLDRGCMCVGTSPEELSGGLQKLMALQTSNIDEIALASREFVMENFSWASISKESLAVYSLKDVSAVDTKINVTKTTLK